MVHFEYVQLVWEKCQICADFYPNPEEFTKHKCSQSEEDQLKWALEQSKLEHSTLFDYLLIFQTFWRLLSLLPKIFVFGVRDLNFGHLLIFCFCLTV